MGAGESEGMMDGVRRRKGGMKRKQGEDDVGWHHASHFLGRCNRISGQEAPIGALVTARNRDLGLLVVGLSAR
jgi:hypothetical protein